MTLSIRFLPAAAVDIGDAYLWYEDRSPGLGEALLASLEESFVQIQQRPLSFPVVAGNVRRAILRRFPYCVYFENQEHNLVVTAVLHGRRKPSTWQRRKPQ